MAKHKIKERKVYSFALKISGILLSLLMANIILYLIEPESSWWEFYNEGHLGEIIFSIVSVSLIYAVIFSLINFFSKWIDRKSIFKDNILVLFCMTTAVVVISMFLLLLIEDWLWTLYYSFSECDAEMQQAFRNYLFVNMVVAAFINSFFYTYNYFSKWKAEMMESNRLALLSHELSENTLKAELQVLKLQLDPHFLFNNFSVLTQLIRTDQENAEVFLENLSKVYRYILVNAKRDLTTIGDEIKFLETYFHLMKIRLGSSINLIIDVDHSVLDKGIPPLTLQLLLENAIKHNLCTQKQPLTISITSNGNGQIIVKNNLQRINIEYKGTGLGLSNISERYFLISGIKPEVNYTDKEFVVTLPLLNF